MLVRNLAIVFLAALALGACTTSEKKMSGTLIGAGGGAAIGSSLSGGSVLGAAVGGAGGAYLGHEVGGRM